MKIKIHEINMMSQTVCMKRDCTQYKDCRRSNNGDHNPEVTVTLKGRDILMHCMDYGLEE